MPNLSTTASLSGTIYYSNGKPASGKSVIIKRVLDQNMNLISTDHTIVKSNASGQFTAIVPQNSFVYVYSDVESYTTKNGSVVYIGSDTSYELRTLTADIDYPTFVPIAVGATGGSTDLSDYYNKASSDARFSSTGHTHTIYATTGSLSAYSDVNHTHSLYATTGSLSSYIPQSSSGSFSATSHTHSLYATTGSLSGYVATSATGAFSLSSHSHNQYALTSTLNNYVLNSTYNLDHHWINVSSTLTSQDTPTDIEIIGVTYDNFTSYVIELAICTFEPNNALYHVERVDAIISIGDGTMTLIDTMSYYSHQSHSTSVVVSTNGTSLFVTVTGLIDTDIYWYVHACTIG